MAVYRAEIPEVQGFEQVAGFWRNQGTHRRSELADEMLGVALFAGIASHHVPDAVLEMVV